LEASSMKGANHSWVESIKPKLLSAARWMTDPRNEVPGRKHDAPYTHRNYLDAAAIGETGILTEDQALIDHSKIYVEDGIRKQDKSGFNPEKGGSDTSYHAVGLLFAIDYYTLVADDSQRKKMSPMIQKGLAWLQTKTRDDGTIDQHGNTRTGFGQEVGRNGTKKFMSYGSAYRSAYAWAMITGDASLATYAQKLHDGQEIEKKQREKSGDGG
jgi:hypothetical protein